MKDTVTTRRTDYIALDDLVPQDRNPKNHDIQGIKDSFRQFGFGETPMVDERTGKVIAGHGRIEALKELRSEGAPPPEGITDDWQVPVQRGWRSENDDRANGYLVSSNQWTIKGGWDHSELVALLDSLDDLDGVGFTLDELDEMAKANAVPKFSPVSPDELPRLDEKDPITCPECGHSWQKD